jgi:predicted phage terminase large subunit-like protein
MELLRRQRARASLAEYARSIDIPGAPIGNEDETEIFKPIDQTMARHHWLICDLMQRTMERPMGRAIITMPPGAAKSSYASVVSPSWALCKWPGYRIIIASYNTKIAAKQSRKARALCRSERHRSIWPTRPTLAGDQKAVDQWAITFEDERLPPSEFMAAGMLAGITGNRANGFLMDDPIKGREEADSATIRDKVYDEYLDSATTRLLPNGWIVLITTRWHEDDPAGRILPEKYAGESGRILCRDGQYWEVLNIPAKAEHADDPLGRQPGEYLWPEWFPREHWAQWELNPRAARTWSALFQQRPTAGEGLEFKREWFKWYDPDIEPGKPGGRPKDLTIYGASDYATKEDKGDFTEHGIIGIAEGERRNVATITLEDRAVKAAPLYVLDWWFGQKTTDVTIDAAVSLVHRWKPRRWWNEGGPIDSAISPAIRRAMQEHQPPVFVTIEGLTSIKNKAFKLASFQARAAAGLVYLPINRPWATRLLDQLCAFPAGKYDDGPDVCGLIGRGIDAMMAPQASTPETRKQLLPFTAAWLEANEEQPMKPRYA